MKYFYFDFFPQSFKNVKAFLVCGPYKTGSERNWAHGPCLPARKLGTYAGSLRIPCRQQHYWCSPHAQAHSAWKIPSPLQAAWIHITVDLEGAVRIMYSYLLILHLRKLSLKEVNSHNKVTAVKSFHGSNSKTIRQQLAKREGSKVRLSTWAPFQGSEFQLIHPSTHPFIHRLFLETAWVPVPVWGSGEPDIS